MNTLTEKQKAVYDYLLEIQRSGKTSPSILELAGHFGYRSTRSVRDHLKALERKGAIRRDAHKARSIRVLDLESQETRSVEIPLLGSIAAGHPEPKEQDVERYVRIDPQSVGFLSTTHCFALRVTGDSMTGRDIREGDIVIVDGTKKPRNGDIVAALIDNGTTLKTLERRHGQFFLKPANDDYPDMVPASELVIQGVVRTIIRNVC